MTNRTPTYKVRLDINAKIQLLQQDITKLKVDAITNAANETLLGGGGVDGAIHRAAGPKLLKECTKLNGCKTGEAKITKGYNLPAKHVIHTVGPVGENPQKLQSCYFNCLELTKKHNLSSIAFPCISTGIYCYPNDKAAGVALKTVREWLENHDNSSLQKVIFCLFMPKDVEVYEKLQSVYFPTEHHVTPNPSGSSVDKPHVKKTMLSISNEKNKTPTVDSNDGFKESYVSEPSDKNIEEKSREDAANSTLSIAKVLHDTEKSDVTEVNDKEVMEVSEKDPVGSSNSSTKDISHDTEKTDVTKPNDEMMEVSEKDPANSLHCSTKDTLHDTKKSDVTEVNDKQMMEVSEKDPVDSSNSSTKDISPDSEKSNVTEANDEMMEVSEKDPANSTNSCTKNILHNIKKSDVTEAKDMIEVAKEDAANPIYSSAKDPSHDVEKSIVSKASGEDMKEISKGNATDSSYNSSKRLTTEN